MPTKKTKTRGLKDFAPHREPEKAPICQVDGCTQAGAYKAPKSRDKLDEYDWFCLDHIRERNKQWDYFSGMKSDEIEAFIHDAVTGHRPTWSRESRLRDSTLHSTLQDKLYEFLHGTKPMPSQQKPRIPIKTRNALAVMDLANPYTLKQLKTCYRTLVKKHHPDTNKGNKESEEKFKQITSAYKYLLEQITEKE